MNTGVWDRGEEPLLLRIVWLIRSPMDDLTIADWSTTYGFWCGLPGTALWRLHTPISGLLAGFIMAILIAAGTKWWRKQYFTKVVFNLEKLEAQADEIITSKLDLYIKDELAGRSWKIFDSDGKPSLDNTLRQIVLETRSEFGPVKILLRKGIKLNPKSTDTKLTDQIQKYLDEWDITIFHEFHKRLDKPFELIENESKQEHTVQSSRMAGYFAAEREAMEFLQNHPDFTNVSQTSSYNDKGYDMIFRSEVTGAEYAAEIKTGDFKKNERTVKIRFEKMGIEYVRGSIIGEKTNIFYGRLPEFNDSFLEENA